MTKALDNIVKLASFVTLRQFGALGDGSDVTDIMQQAVNSCALLLVQAGTYVLNSVDVAKSVTIFCEPGVVFKRADNADGSSYGYNRMSGMFTIRTNGVELQILGSPTFDGNYANQPAIEPGGCAIFVTPPAVPTSDPISVYVENGKFINGTSEYLLIRGDDVRRRYRVDVTLKNPTFTGGVYGKGKSDPGTPTAVGYTPSYVHILDYVVLRTYDLKASFDRPLSLGVYAPIAVWGSYAGSDYTQAGNCSVLMYGRTEIRGVGRAAWKYNDINEFVTNNGLGCIDCYGNADELYIEDIWARDTHYAPVRAKGSCRVYTVQHADFQNCWRGLEVSPSSTGPCETVVHVGKITCRDGTIPQIQFCGSSATDQLYSVDIDSAYCFGTQTNPENLANQGNIRLKNAGKVTARAVAVIGSPSNGVQVEDVDRAHIGELIANNNAGNAVRVSSSTGAGQFILDRFDIRACGAEGIWILAGLSDVTLRGGKIDGAVNYGVFNQSTANAHIQNVTVANVSGSSRGFYNVGGNVTMLGNIATVGVTTGLFYVKDVYLREAHNSWNRREVQGAYASTLNGTWKQNDIVWNNAAASGQAIGWICTVGGTDTGATFKAMANLP